MKNFSLSNDCYVCNSQKYDDYSIYEEYSIDCYKCGQFIISREALEDIRDEGKNIEASKWIRGNAQGKLVCSDDLHGAGILSPKPG